MGEFEPNVDDTGQTDDGGRAQAQDNVSIPKEEWESLKTKLDHFETNLSTMANPTQQQAPMQPQGPTLQETISPMEQELEEVLEQIDSNIENGRGIKALNKKRASLERKITSTRIRHEDLDPIRNMGMQTINQLTSEVSRSKMPHYELVKKDFEEFMSNLTQEQQMNMDVRQIAYNQAVGKNSEKIFQAQMEQQNREAAAKQAGIDANSVNRPQKQKFGEVEVPAFEDVMSTSAVQALREKGLTADQEFQRRGFAGGWPEYYAKHKDFI